MMRTTLQRNAVKTTVEKYFVGAAPMELYASRVANILSTAHSFEKPALLTSLDPTTAAPIDIGGVIASQFEEWGNFSIGGLAGVPFGGKTGWELFRHRAKMNGKSDLLVVYGCDCYVSSSGEIVGGPSAIGAAFNTVDSAGGIAGINDSLLTDRNDQQMAHLLLEVSKVYETDLVSHPEPYARLAIANFAMVQTYLRKCIDWGEMRDGRLAALGGLTIHLPVEGSGDDNHGFAGEGGCAMHAGEPLFLPLSFELFDPSDGALFDLLGDAMGTKGVHSNGAESTRRRRQRRHSKRPQGPPRLHRNLLFPLDESDSQESGGDSEERLDVPPPPPTPQKSWWQRLGGVDNGGQ
jgi:hypothetical protein